MGKYSHQEKEIKRQCVLISGFRPFRRRSTTLCRGEEMTSPETAFREHQLLRLRHGPRRIASYPFRFVPEAGWLISLSAALTARSHCSSRRLYLLALPLLTATARARRTVKGVLRVRVKSGSNGRPPANNSGSAVLTEGQNHPVYSWQLQRYRCFVFVIYTCTWCVRITLAERAIKKLNTHNSVIAL